VLPGFSTMSLLQDCRLHCHVTCWHLSLSGLAICRQLRHSGCSAPGKLLITFFGNYGMRLVRDADLVNSRISMTEECSYHFTRTVARKFIPQ